MLSFYDSIMLKYIIYFLFLYQLKAESCNQIYTDDLVVCKHENDRCSVASGIETVDEMNCFCDPECDMYEDCCSNFGYVSLKTEDQKLFSCVKNPSGLYPSYIYMYTLCPLIWADQKVRYYCESEEGLKSKKPLQAIPVTNPISTKTYKNVYCAICNGENTKNLFRWVTTIDCGLNWNTHSNYIQSLSEAVHRKLLNFNRTDASWYIRVEHQDYPLKCSSCTTSALPTIDLPLRRCEQYISTCSDKYDNEVITKRCNKYTAYRYVKQGSEIITYKNKDCAKCNFVPPEELQCKRPVINISLSNNICYNASFPTFSCLYEPLIKQKCISGFAYNSFYKKCILQ